MKAVINRKELLNAISIGGSMAEKNSVLPILNTIKFTITGNKAKIISSDNEVFISHKFSVINSDEDVCVCINEKDFSSAIKSIKDEDVLIIFDNNTLSIEYKAGRITIPYEEADGFPTPKINNNTEKHSIRSERLYEWLKSARMFVSDDNLRPILNGVNIIIEEGKLGAVATNGTVLYYDFIDYNYSGETINAVIVTKAIPTILNMINGTDETKITIGSNNIVLSTETTTLVTTKLEGTYPNFKSVIPTNHSIEVTTAKSEITETFNRMLLFANQGSKLIKLNIRDVVMTVTASDFDLGKECSEQCDCQNDGMEITIGINGKYIQNCINSINSDELIIRMSTPQRPIVFKDKNNENKVIILMPMLVV